MDGTTVMPTITTKLPGWTAITLVAVACQFLSSLIVIGGKTPVGAVVLAIIFGIIFRAFFEIPKVLAPGVKAFEKPLVIGIVLLGATLDLSLLTTNGIAILALIICTMTAGIISIYFLGKKFGLNDSLSTLLAVGTSICGGTAIAIVAPIIKAKDEETSYAIATIALFGLIAILLYPLLGRYFNLTDMHFGVFAGTAIHSTPQVVGAGFIYSEEAGKIATAIKLVRNCFLVPVVFFISLYWTKFSKNTSTSKKGNFLQVFPWFLFGYFIMAGLSSAGIFSVSAISWCKTSGKLLVLIGMAGIGLNTSFTAIRAVGSTPILIGFLGSAIVATVSISLSYFFFVLAG